MRLSTLLLVAVFCAVITAVFLDVRQRMAPTRPPAAAPIGRLVEQAAAYLPGRELALRGAGTDPHATYGTDRASLLAAGKVRELARAGEGWVLRFRDRDASCDPEHGCDRTQITVTFDSHQRILEAHADRLPARDPHADPAEPAEPAVRIQP